MPLLELQIPEEIDDAINSVSTDKIGLIFGCPKTEVTRNKKQAD